MNHRKRTEIVIELDEVRILERAARPILAWCLQCSDHVQMTTPSWAAMIADVTTRTVYKWVEAGRVHFTETPAGSLLICVDSLPGFEFGSSPSARQKKSSAIEKGCQKIMKKLLMVFAIITTVVLVEALASAQTQTHSLTNKDPESSAERAETRQVFASVAGESIRFASLADLIQIRLEVIGSSGAVVFDSDFKAGNLIDWALTDKLGRRLADGSYLCVVSVKDLSGVTNRRRVIAILRDQSPDLKQPDESLLSSAQAEAAGAVAGLDDSLNILEPGASPATAVLAHDGNTAHLVSGSGGLSISSGDFFANKLLEHIRFTAEGNVGIGTSNPQTRLDVAGSIRTGAGIVFPDGTIQYSASSKTLGAKSARRDSRSGTEADFQTQSPESITQGRIVKFMDNAGTLGDSIMFESAGGNIGVGTTTPSKKLDVTGGQIALDNSRFLYSRRTNGQFQEAFGIDSNNDIIFNRNSIVSGVDPDAPKAPSSLIFGTGAGKFIDFRNSSNTSMMRVDEATGRIGIGLAAPSYPLTVSGTAGTGENQGVAEFVSSVPDTGLRIRNTTAGGRTYTLFSSGTSSGLGAGTFNIFDPAANATRLAINSTGNVGIGTAASSSKLSVAGVIESTTGGLKFPDGTIQTTAGGGGLTLPFTGSVNSGSTAFSVTNNGTGEGVFGKGKNGVHGQSSSATDSGVWGESIAGGFGVSGSTTSNGQTSVAPAGVWGHNLGSGFGVKGTSNGIGVYGAGDTGAYGAGNVTGVSGLSTSGFGVSGTTVDGTGVYGDNGNSNTTGHAGYFNGRVTITGNLNANNLAGAKASQEHSGAGFGQPANTTHEVDRVTINVPDAGVLVLSAFVNAEKIGGNLNEGFDFDFVINQVLPSNEEVTLILVKTQGTCTFNTFCRQAVNLSWVLPVNGPGPVTVKTATITFSRTLGLEGDHNLSVVYLPKQY